MRTSLALAVGLALATGAQAQGNPQQLLQGLMNGGNQGNRGDNDQAIREAYERGYEKGRQDEARLGADRRGGDRGREDDQRGRQQPYGR